MVLSEGARVPKDGAARTGCSVLCEHRCFPEQERTDPSLLACGEPCGHGLPGLLLIPRPRRGGGWRRG